MTFSTARNSPGARDNIKREKNSPEARSFSSAVQAARFLRLREFILTQSKQRCQDQERSTAGTWPAMLKSDSSFALVIGSREVSRVAEFL